jgi:hypothetical protein
MALASSGKYVPAYDSPARMIGFCATVGCNSTKLSSA